MADQSIFHNIVKGETAHTQLLCNMLKRDEKFRDAFLEMIGLSGIRVTASDIRAEVHLDGHGKPDIQIKTKTVCVLVEIKTELGRKLENNQRLDTGKDSGYRSYLREQKRPDLRVRLVYLIPAAWKYADEIKKEIRVYKEKSEHDGIEADDPITWEDIIGLLQESKHVFDGCYSTDFKLLLEERFGSIVFTREEVKVMEDESFPVEVFVKLIKFLDDLREQTNIQSKKEKKKGLEIQKSEIGFGTEFGGEPGMHFWVGFWPELWESKKKLLCFGIKNAPDRVRRAFSESFRNEYGLDEFVGPDGYLMGFVPSNDLQGSGKFEETRNKLMRIWVATYSSVA